MSGDDKKSGQDAIKELGARLKELLEGVAGAIEGKNAEGGETDKSARSSGPIKTEMGWSVKLGGLELSGDNLADLQSRAPFEPGRHPGAARRASRPRTAAKERPSKAKSATQPDAAPAPRNAHVEIFDELDAVIVTAELPGVAAEDVALDLQGERLEIRAEGPRPFRAEAELPKSFNAAADPEMRLANGVLEIRIPKASAE